MWAAHPGELTKWVEARAWTLRGTHVRPQEDGAPTLTYRVQAWEISTRNTLRHTRWQVKAEANPWSRLGRVAVPDGVAVVRRANTAYDFGSWAYALRTWPQLAHKDLVVLTNDSLVGPLGPLEELLRRPEQSTPRVCGATSAGPRRSCTCPAPRTCLCGPGASWPQRASPSSSGPC